VIVVGGKPYKSVSNFVNDGRFHLVTVDYDRPPAGATICPPPLTAKDYPNLIAEGDKVDTIASPRPCSRPITGAPNTDRYRKLSLFVDAFFTKFPKLQNPPFPSEVEGGLARRSAYPGWQAPAGGDRKWLDEHGLAANNGARNRFDEFMKTNAGPRATCNRTPSGRRCSSNSRPGRRKKKNPGGAATTGRKSAPQPQQLQQR